MARQQTKFFSADELKQELENNPHAKVYQYAYDKPDQEYTVAQQKFYISAMRKQYLDRLRPYNEKLKHDIEQELKIMKQMNATPSEVYTTICKQIPSLFMRIKKGVASEPGVLEILEYLQKIVNKSIKRTELIRYINQINSIWSVLVLNQFEDEYLMLIVLKEIQERRDQDMDEKIRNQIFKENPTWFAFFRNNKSVLARITYYGIPEDQIKHLYYMLYIREQVEQGNIPKGTEDEYAQTYLAQNFRTGMSLKEYKDSLKKEKETEQKLKLEWEKQRLEQKKKTDHPLYTIWSLMGSMVIMLVGYLYLEAQKLNNE